MKRIAIDIETTVKDGENASPYLDDIHCISLNDGNREWIEYDPTKLEAILVDPDILKIFHGGAFDLKFLLHRINENRLYDIKIQNVWDTLIAERMLTAGKNDPCDLEETVRRYFVVDIDKNVRKTFMRHIGPLSAQQLEYAKGDVRYLLKLQQSQSNFVDERGMTHIMDIENRLVPLVAEMELYGIGFDPVAWDRVMEIERKLLPQLERKVQEQLCDSFQYDVLAGRFVGTINLNSTKQLQAALRRIGISTDSTDEEALKHIDHPVAKDILDYREHAKRLQWNYLDHVNPVTGRIHPDIVQTGADTGRFSCKSPNLQNVPHDQEFRDMFIPGPGNVFVIADYGQQELRVLAEYCRDPNLIESCKREDPHLTNAWIIYDDTSITKSDDRRRIAKACSFALVYGAGYATIGSGAGISAKEAKRAHRALHKKFPGVDVWGRKSWEFLKQNGYLTTLGGRRRYFPWVYQDPGKYMTVARNTPIQGTSADMMKLAMLNIDGRIKPLGGRLVMCIHDEIIVECSKEVGKEVAEQVELGMVDAGEYYVKVVPIIAESVISEVWQK